MLVYEGVKTGFINDVDLNLITDKILKRFKEVFHRSTGESEVNSWRESMLRMRGVLADNEIPDNAGVAIEFNIPHTSNRIDFLLSGYDKNKNNSIIIIELKQWTHADAIEGKDGVVSTFTGRALREVTHPSYQAWSYASLINSYNQEVYDRNVGLHPCAFLHNYDLSDNDPIKSEQYRDYINEAPMFGSKDFEKLREFIKKYVTEGDDKEGLYIIENGKIKPSKMLQDSFSSVLKGNKEFVFKGSGCFYDCESNAFDVLIVDEAHRLNKKSGLFSNLGENQIKEIINASMFSIFFIDENQRVTLKDNGSIEEIKKYARYYNEGIHKMNLKSQFRCDGSDGYLAWLDNILEIKETANFDLDSKYDFKVFDDPNELREAIEGKNKINNKSRLVAGYCWNWVSEGKNKSDIHDIVIPEYDFGMSWNLGNSNTWAIDKESINEIGCIHTCQGLEFDYVGVIVGDDLRYENGHIVTDYTKRAKTDQSLKGINKIAKERGLEEAKKIADEIIKNTYKTLMTRGMKGCYIYCTDKKLQEYLKSNIIK